VVCGYPIPLFFKEGYLQGGVMEIYSHTTFIHQELCTPPFRHPSQGEVLRKVGAYPFPIFFLKRVNPTNGLRLSHSPLFKRGVPARRGVKNRNTLKADVYYFHAIFYICFMLSTQNPDIITTIRGTAIKSNYVKNLPYNPKLKQLARDKRKAGILSEVLFWMEVRNNTFHQIDFDRQRVIGNFIVDFYIKSLGVVVEIDGSSHDGNTEHDMARQRYLEEHGLKVFRCTDFDVKKHIGQVMESLEDFIMLHFGIVS
jgi:very-short-patch-repair endonuclease